MFLCVDEARVFIFIFDCNPYRKDRLCYSFIFFFVDDDCCFKVFRMVCEYACSLIYGVSLVEVFSFIGFKKPVEMGDAGIFEVHIGGRSLVFIRIWVSLL